MMVFSQADQNWPFLPCLGKTFHVVSHFLLTEHGVHECVWVEVQSQDTNEARGCATCRRQRWYAMRYQWHLGIADNEGCLFSPSCLGTLGSTFGPKKLGHVVPNLAVLTFYPQTCGISLALHWPLVSASPSAGALWWRWLVCHPHVPCNKSLHIHMPGDVWGQYLH